MCKPVFWNDLFAFVDGILRLDVERSEENSRDLSNFAEWKRDGKTSNNVVGYKFLEEFLFLFVPLWFLKLRASSTSFILFSSSRG